MSKVKSHNRIRGNDPVRRFWKVRTNCTPREKTEESRASHSWIAYQGISIFTGVVQKDE